MTVNLSASLPDENRNSLEILPDEFLELAKIAKKNFGLDLQNSKKPLIASRLRKRLDQLNLQKFSAYLHLLQDKDNGSELEILASALTTNVTKFFREPHHFTFLSDHVVPRIKEKILAGEGVRIWSAACSSGEEPYSIAAILHKNIPDIHRHDIKILATDLDQNMVQIGRSASYHIDSMKDIPDDLKNAICDPKLTSGGKFVIRPEIQSLVSFRNLNLIDTWPMKKSFDIVFCRNVAIYFDDVTQEKLWSRFLDKLVPSGYLMIGHSERIKGQSAPYFKNVGITTYQKK